MSKINHANAIWQGDLKNGKGTATLPSIDEEVNYSFSSRFEADKGTNPEELIAAAHAQCFSMQLSGILTKNDYEPEKISTKAEISLEPQGEGFAITKSTLNCTAKVPGISEENFLKIANEAKETCPVSMALSSITITLEASLGN